MKQTLEGEMSQKLKLVKKVQSLQGDKIKLMSERDHAVNKLLIYLNKD